MNQNNSCVVININAKRYLWSSVPGRSFAETEQMKVLKTLSEDLQAFQSKTNDSTRQITGSSAFQWKSYCKESELSRSNQSSIQTQHSNQSTQGDFLLIHTSIGQEAALCTLIRFPIQCGLGPGLALVVLSWGDACCVNDSRQILWQASETHCPFNSSDRTSVNSPSRRLSLSGMFPSKLVGSSPTEYWPWVARIDFRFWHTDEGRTVHAGWGGGGFLHGRQPVGVIGNRFPEFRYGATCLRWWIALWYPINPHLQERGWHLWEIYHHIRHSENRPITAKLCMLSPAQSEGQEDSFKTRFIR